MFFQQKKAFTLIELTIVIIIVVILSTLLYSPYSYYQKVAEVRNAKEHFSQSLSDAKIAAASGLSFSWVSENLDSAVVFEKGGSVIHIIAIPSGKSLLDTSTQKNIRDIEFDTDVHIASFTGVTYSGSLAVSHDTPTKVAVRFLSPMGTMKIFALDSGVETELSSLSGGTIAFRDASFGSLISDFSLKTY